MPTQMAGRTTHHPRWGTATVRSFPNTDYQPYNTSRSGIDVRIHCNIQRICYRWWSTSQPVHDDLSFFGGIRQSTPLDFSDSSEDEESLNTPTPVRGKPANLAPALDDRQLVNADSKTPHPPGWYTVWVTIWFWPWHPDQNDKLFQCLFWVEIKGKKVSFSEFYLYIVFLRLTSVSALFVGATVLLIIIHTTVMKKLLGISTAIWRIFARTIGTLKVPYWTWWR